MPRFISDAEMAKLEAGNTTTKSRRFISDDEMLKMEQAEKNPEGGSRALLESFGSAATLGYLPQIQAVASQFMPNPNAKIDDELRAKGFTIEQRRPSYVEERDANIKRIEQQSKDFPGASIAGNVAGSIATGIASSAALPINAASKFGRLAQAARGGAALGAISNPGDKEGVLNPIQSGERLKNASSGAAVGVAGQGVIEGLSSTVQGILNLPNKLTGKAEERAFKSSGAMLKDYRKAAEKDRINEIGREMLGKGLVKPGFSVNDVAERSAQLKEEAGTIISNTYKAANDQLKNSEVLNKLTPEQRQKIASLAFNPAQFADEFESSLKSQFKGTAGFSKSLPQVQSVLEDIRQMGDSADLLQLQKAKVDVQNLINYDKDIRDQPLAKQLLAKLRTALSDKVQNQIDSLDSILGVENLKPLKEANRQYGIWSEVESIAADRVLRDNANRFFSPTDYLAGGLGAAAGFASGDNMGERIKNAGIGLSIGAANKAMRTYGTPIVSQGLNKAGQLLGKTNIQEASRVAKPVLEAAEKSPSAIANTVRALSKPEFEQSASSVMRSVAEEKPRRGEDKWAYRGLEKLGIDDQQTIDQLLKSKEMRRLLIEASDLPEGSKRLNSIKQKISQGRRE